MLIYVPLISTTDDPLISIMDTLGAHYTEQEALECCVEGDYLVELKVVKVSKAKTIFILEDVTDDESNNSPM